MTSFDMHSSRALHILSSLCLDYICRDPILLYCFIKNLYKEVYYYSERASTRCNLCSLLNSSLGFFYCSSTSRCAVFLRKLWFTTTSNKFILGILPPADRIGERVLERGQETSRKMSSPDGATASAESEEKCLSSVAVYCSAKDHIKPVYGEKAKELGACLVSKKISVVFGGSMFGLLGKLADSVISNGGKITGVIPEFFTKYENYVSCGNEIVVPDMHTRKKMMFDSVEAFVALPGGIGTMEELMEVLTWANLDLHSKPIALLNVNGYYDHFIQWLSHSIEEGFVRQVSSVDELLVISDDPKELVDKLCSKWKETNGTTGSSTIADEAV